MEPVATRNQICLRGSLLGLPIMMLTVFLFHTSGCVGDFYFAWLIARHPEADQVEDTPVGIRLWASGGDEGGRADGETDR